jgi:hypothetical protein
MNGSEVKYEAIRPCHGSSDRETGWDMMRHRAEKKNPASLRFKATTTDAATLDTRERALQSEKKSLAPK